jgi:hypothetical protein
MQCGMGTMKTNMVSAVREEGQKTRDSIATGLEDAARSFRGGRGRGGMVSQEQVQRLAAMTVDTGGLSDTTNHHFYGSHKSVQSFYNEYYELEDFDGIPISGGLLAMEEN